MIPVAAIARLAELYDHYNNSLDPFSKDCLTAKQEFDELVNTLHSARAADVELSAFRYELVRHCRDYLAQKPTRNTPQRLRARAVSTIGRSTDPDSAP